MKYKFISKNLPQTNLRKLRQIFIFSFLDSNLGLQNSKMIAEFLNFIIGYKKYSGIVGFLLVNSDIYMKWQWYK